jgi:DNA-binding IclR family transcriptional regulator
MDFFTKGRLERKQALLEMVQKFSPIEEEKLLGVFSLKTGLTFKKIREYLDELVSAGLIERDESTLRIPGEKAP